MKDNFTCLLLLFFCVAGCSSSIIKKEVRTPSSTENPQCLTECSKDQVCMNTFTEKGAVCATIPEEPRIIFTLPFDSNTEVVCTHSKGVGSHSGCIRFSNRLQ